MMTEVYVMKLFMNGMKVNVTSNDFLNSSMLTKVNN